MTTKVRLLVSRAGVDFAHAAGDIVEVSAAEAARMVEAGQAEMLRQATPERAVKRGKPEQAASVRAPVGDE